MEPITFKENIIYTWKEVCKKMSWDIGRRGNLSNVRYRYPGFFVKITGTRKYKDSWAENRVIKGNKLKQYLQIRYPGLVFSGIVLFIKKEVKNEVSEQKSSTGLQNKQLNTNGSNNNVNGINLQEMLSKYVAK